jgi:hypothetical protein
VNSRPASQASSRDDIVDSLVFYRGDEVEATTLFVFGTMQNIAHFGLQIKKLWDTLGLTHVIISGYQGEAESIAMVAFQLGVPAQAMTLETRASNTFENVFFSRSLLRKACPNQAVHILSKEHCALRCYLTFHKILPEWKVSIHTTHYLNAAITNWRSNPVFLRLVVEEIGKISTYLEAGDLAVPASMLDKVQLVVKAREGLAFLEQGLTECVIEVFEPPESEVQPLLKCADSIKLISYDAQQDLVLFERCFSPAASRRGRIPKSLQLFSGEFADAGSLAPITTAKGLLPAGTRVERVIFAGKFFPTPSLSLERTTLYCALVSVVGMQADITNTSLECIATECLPAMLIDGKSFDGVAFGAIAWFISAKPYLQHLANHSTNNISCD